MLAQDILAERFARGEISAEEYRSLLQTLNASLAGEASVESSGRAEASPRQASLVDRLRRLTLRQLLLAIGGTIFVILAATFAYSFHLDSQRLVIRSFTVSGFFNDYLTIEVVNRANPREIYVWYELNGVYYCPQRTEVARNQVVTLRGRCLALPMNTRGITPHASMDPPRWVRENARFIR